ncbi:MAG TPA: SRPBCC domain-containing protein [Mucilaginibacter sp.]|nr:SRPBCC domain-containing protein [Mucilaginibacter sp.]
MKNQTKIIADPGKQELFIIREFDAPRELVFKAFTTVELLEQFFAPNNRVTKYEYFNCHDNGSYKYATCDENGKILCVFKGAIHEVAAPERIIQTSELDGMPVKGHVVLDAMTFESIDGNSTRLTIHDVCISVSDRDMIVNSGMEGGLVQIFDKLETLLAEQIKN